MSFHRIALAPALLTATLLAGCSTSNAPQPAAATATAAVADAAASAPSAAPQITLGDGDANWIVIEGVTRTGSTLTFREVQIEGNGWLVLHPFKDGRPNGAIHVGASYLRDGLNQDVSIKVEQTSTPATGQMFLVMLHRDVNENQEFDFVFVDERNVLDKAVFEGTTMIAHAIAAP